jgi:hypothetical protein
MLELEDNIKFIINHIILCGVEWIHLVDSCETVMECQIPHSTN